MAVVSGSSVAASKGKKARRRGGGKSAVTTPGTRKNLGFIGARHRPWGRWASELRVPRTRERLWIGTFASPVEAALAYDAAVFCFYGAHIPRLRKINFPDAPRPNISEDVRVRLSVGNIRAIAGTYALSLAGFYVPPPPPPELPAAAPPPPPPPPPPEVVVKEAPPAPEPEQAVDASVVVGAAPTTDSGNGSHGSQEYISFADCLLSFQHYDFDAIMDCVSTDD